MKVAKWGNCLAIRIPASVVEALDLKEGESIEICIQGDRSLAVGRSNQKKEALERLRTLRRPLPVDFRFDREQTNER